MDVKVVDITQYELFKDLKPQKSETIPYLREEKNGYFSMLTNNGDSNYTMINKTSKQILDLCNGETSVDQLWNFMCRQYTTIPAETLKKDLLITLGELTRLNAIEWADNTNPYVLSASAIITDQISVCLAGESDIRDLSHFFVSFVKKFKESSDSSYDSDNSYKYFWGTDYREYTSPIIIRQCLYSYFKDFFVVKRQGEILGVISVKPAYESYLHDATIQMLSVPKELFKPVLSQVLDYYVAFPFKKINTIKVSLPESYVERNTQLVDDLMKIGFSLSCLDKKEYGKDEDLHTYSIQLRSEDSKAEVI